MRLPEHLLALGLLAAGLAPPVCAEEDIGIFETILESSQGFDETSAALEAALAASAFDLQATHDVRVPDGIQHARVFVLTSQAYAAAAARESPRTISAQVLRLGVFTSGEEQQTRVNMANPVAHALVFYAGSVNADALLAAAEGVAGDLRDLVATLPGRAVSIQSEPLRAAGDYRDFNGDGPAKMMARFRRWEKSQQQILRDSAANFETVVERVVERIRGSTVGGPDEPKGWELVSRIRLRDDVVHLGISNPYVEDRMIRINSRFRDEGKSEASPYPGVDHVPALPIEVLVVREGDRTVVRHYGQMWRMQLYFWDSGYRAFTANVGVPGSIMDSIEDTIEDSR